MTYQRRVLDENPGWGNGSRGVYWTPERIAEALRRYVDTTNGQLPSSSDDWNRIKKGRLDLPVGVLILQQYGSMSSAWSELGAPRSRIRVGQRPWTEEEITFLLENAGDLTLKQIAQRLHRSWAACKRKCYELGTRARDAQGYMSAQQVADEYGCTPNRVQDLIERGVLKARRPRGGQRLWRIAPEDAAKVADQLRHDESPPLDRFDTYLSTREAAARVGLTVGSLWTYLRSGELPAVRRGRRYYITERAIERFTPRSMRPLGMTPREIEALPTLRRGAPLSAEAAS